MYKNLETYLEEIGHFLSGPVERKEILAEIRFRSRRITGAGGKDAGRQDMEHGRSRDHGSTQRLACWVDLTADTIALVLISVVLRQQHGNLFAVDVPSRLVTWVYGSLTVILFVVALFVAIDLVKNLVRLGRGRLAK